MRRRKAGKSWLDKSRLSPFTPGPLHTASRSIVLLQNKFCTRSVIKLQFHVLIDCNVAHERIFKAERSVILRRGT
jgi:hypothetical protein